MVLVRPEPKVRRVPGLREEVPLIQNRPGVGRGDGVNDCAGIATVWLGGVTLFRVRSTKIAARGCVVLV